MGPLQAIDYLRVHYSQRGSGYTSRITEWHLAAGEQRRNQDAFELAASGESRFGRSVMRSVVLNARLGEVSAGLGDVAYLPLGRMGTLQRLRGVSVSSATRSGAFWRGVSGVPTPSPGVATPRLGIAGAMIENLKFDAALTSLSLFGFGRGRVPRGSGVLPGDTLAGLGGLAAFDVRAPLPLGMLSLSLGAQIHGLDGPRGLAAQHGIGWMLNTPRYTFAIYDERATGRTRILRTEGLAPAPLREDRWTAQARFPNGRAETHFTGVLRDGGDPSVAAHTMQLGGSGNWGRSTWYSGADLYFTRRVLERVDERRLSLYSGRIGSRGHGLLLRFDRTADDLGREATQLTGELSFALRRGGRLSVEPRTSWNSGQAQQASTDVRLSWPLQTLAARLTGSVSIGAARDDGFRATMREAMLAISLAPRPRDRADLEVRRRDEWGVRSYETTASYDLAAQRYENLGGARPARNDGEVVVQVLRADRTGAADVLVLLDGRESRFTDASGVARFERVSPGVHLISVEERSLPSLHQVVGAARAFVTVERGRETAPVTFEIARPAKRTRF